MSKLVSDAAMTALRNLAILGMQTTVTVKRLTSAENAVGEAQSWTTSGTYKGWLHSTVSPMMTIVSGAQALVNTYRLYLPVGTDISTGDRVVIGSETYTVSDTDAESTWLPVLTVSLRKAE